MEHIMIEILRLYYKLTMQRRRECSQNPLVNSILFETFWKLLLLIRRYLIKPYIRDFYWYDKCISITLAFKEHDSKFLFLFNKQRLYYMHMSNYGNNVITTDALVSTIISFRQ